MSFYEDKEERDVKEDVCVRKEEKECVYVWEHKVLNLFSVYSSFLLYYLSWLSSYDI
jgi:hypothetical protein